MDTDTDAGTPATKPLLGVSITALEAIDTADLDIKWPGDDAVPTGWVITFAGPGHPKTVEYNNEVARKNLRRQEKIEAQQLNGKKVKPEGKDVDEQRAENIQWIVARIVGWRGLLDANSQPVPFSPEQAAATFANPKLGWAYAQAVEFLAAAEFFYQALRDDLIEFAERTFALGQRSPEGHTDREILEGMLSRAKTPERREELEAELRIPPPPPALAYLWRTFTRLSDRRASGGFGASAITWSDLDAFIRLTGFRLAPWEIELLERLDSLFLAAQAKSVEERVEEQRQNCRVQRDS